MSETLLENNSNGTDSKTVGFLIMIGIIIIFAIFIIFARNLIKLLGWKQFFILMIIMSILNTIVGGATSCFGKKVIKKENFPYIGIFIFVILTGIMIGVMSFQYYLIKNLGFRNYIIIISILSVLSAVSGYTKNCIQNKI